MADTHEITLLVYPGAQAAAVHGLVDLFAVASRLGQACGRAALPARWRNSPPVSQRCGCTAKCQSSTMASC